jgi:oxygen-independent coproporphyrinogen III oxidase
MTAIALQGDQRLDLGPLYQDYAYGYPHKSAYRAFAAPKRLRDLWADERKNRLFLYLHIPFCEMRCGFCNLFTTANPRDDRIAQYLRALGREMEAAREELGEFRAMQIAIGGGTPTFLGAGALNSLFEKLSDAIGADPRRISTAIETSPKTATRETISCLADWGIERISIGAQSFIEEETRAMGRPQSPAELEAALDTIRSHRFDRLNIDLIYGAANQTVQSWIGSIRLALGWAPEEIYLYPLYVRPGTGLDRHARVEDEHRRSLYRTGRDYLLAAGYEQLSMRAFRRPECGTSASSEYSCQEDGMLGLGAGARSYARRAHYSAEYGVSRRAVLGILDGYASRTAESFRYALHGIEIDDDERMRRFVLKSILRRDGLDAVRFESVFGCAPHAAFPVLGYLTARELLVCSNNHYRPTEAGLEHSDAIPPLFYSTAVAARMASAAIA